MIVKGFEVYDNDDNLIETLPAVLYGGGRVNVTLSEDGTPRYNTLVEITAQVPAGIKKVDFINADTEEVLATVPVVDGKAILEVDWQRVGVLRVRVGEETQTKLNEVVIEGYEE